MAPLAKTQGLTRRLSEYEPSKYYPPLILPAAASPFYSWPRKQAPTSLGAALASSSTSQPPTPVPTQPKGDATTLPEDRTVAAGRAEATSETTPQADPPTAPTPPLKVTEYLLHFTLLPKTADEREVTYKCTRTHGVSRLVLSPVTASLRAPGDVHVHTYMGGIQHWVVGTEISWISAAVGDHHPVLADRVLSHQEPHSSKFPKWVLPATLAKYKTLERRKGA